jgi:hypothetical protein
MVKTPLVEEFKAAGREFLQKLDLTDLDVRAAFWLYRDEPDDWRLIIATPLADRIGSREVYRKLYPLWHEDQKLDWSQITVLGIDDPLVRMIGSVLKTGPGIGGTVFSRNVINGTYIEDAYIYRMNL